MIKITQPVFENKNYGPGGGIPVLKSIWDKFDFSLLFSQAGIRKHSGTPAWIMAFAYICGLIAKAGSANQNAAYSTDAPALQQILQGKPITQSAFSRFLAKPFHWLTFTTKRILVLQENSETRLSDGDIIALDRYVPIAAVAGSFEHSSNDQILSQEDRAVTFHNAYLLISNRWDESDTAAATYLKRWKIEVFYRFAKQELGLTSCYARNESAHLAHIELLFLAQTLLCYAGWVLNKEGAETAPTHCDMVKSFFNACCRICCEKQQIQFYFDTTVTLFASLFQNLWPTFIDLRLWNWSYYPLTA